MTITNIDAKTVEQWLKEGDVVLIDVREPAEHSAEKITGSYLYPLSMIDKKSLPEQKNKKLVLHCRSGKRSTIACQKLLSKHPELEIYNLEGGLESWRAQGYQVEKTSSFLLPLDRQVQLTVGVLIFFSSLLAYVINPLFTILTAFLGLGLMFAGLSGYCGLAFLIAKMPWNQKTSNQASSCKV